MNNFKVHLILLLRGSVKNDLGIDLVNTATDVVKIETSFRGTGGYAREYNSGTYDITGTDLGKNYVIRVYTTTGDYLDISKPIVDRSTQLGLDAIYAYNLTLDKSNLGKFKLDGRAPLAIGELTRAEYCKSPESRTLLDKFGNRMCAGFGNMPVITLVGGNEVTITQNSIWQEPGYEAMDVEDGDLTSRVYIGGQILTDTIGIQGLVYSVTDNDSNTITETRLVTVRIPNAPPVITLLDGPGGAANPINLIEGETWIEPGATATDAEDGDLSANIVIGGDVVDPNVPRTYTISYMVTDSESATSVSTRIVNILANHLPVITLLPFEGAVSPVSLVFGTSYVEPGATAVDNEDGDLTSRIVITGDEVDPNTAGTYNIKYSVTDNNGGVTEVTRIVVVAENAIPVITMQPFNGETTPILLPHGSEYTEPGATAIDLEDGVLTGSIVIGGDTVDHNTAGTYLVTYTCTDSGGASAVATRVVTIAANVAPTISLNPYPATGVSTPIALQSGGLWVDPGYSAHDAEDGNLTDAVVVAGDTVDTNVQNTYNITYTVSDHVGLETTVTRVVNVAANVAPVIMLLGTNPLDVVIDESTFNYYTDFDDMVLNNAIVARSNASSYATPIEAANAFRDLIQLKHDDTALTDIYYLGDQGKYPTYADYKSSYPDAKVVSFMVENPSTGDNYTSTITPVAKATYQVIGKNGYAPSAAVTDATFTTVAEMLVAITSDYDSSPATKAVMNQGADNWPMTIDIVNNADVVEADVVEITTTIEDGAYVEAGFTAADTEDGDLTEDVVIAGDTVDYVTPGDYNITYTATDAMGAVSTVTREVSIKAPERPGILIEAFNGDMDVTLTQGTNWVDPGASAFHPVEGNLTSSVITQGDLVDTSVPGVYNVKYTVSDSDSNITSVFRRVTVKAVPVINLLPVNGFLSPLTLNYGAAWNDAGAEASDGEDGDLTAEIVVSGDTVDPNTAGTYNIIYTVTDSDGNEVSVTREVTVSTSSAPTITLAGENPLTLLEGVTYVDPGASAIDVEDGDLTNAIQITGDVVDTSVIGSYNVVYTVTDVHNNTTSVTRNVNVIANAAPTLELLAFEGDTDIVYIEFGGTTDYVEPGATALDAEDGNISDNIIMNNANTGVVWSVGDIIQRDNEGSTTITYSITDAGGKTTTATREIRVEMHDLNIVLSEDQYGNSDNMYVLQGSTWSDPGYTLEHWLPNPGGSFSITGNIVNTSAAVGTSFAINYDYTDGAGNSAPQVTRTVGIVDAITSITLLGNSSVTIIEGEDFVDPGYTAMDIANGEVTQFVTVGGDTVDTSTPDTYTITYTIVGTETAVVTRTVTVVSSNAAPVITVLGDSPMTVGQHSSFVDPGFTATDEEDGDLTASVITSGGVDTTIPDTYTLTYSVTDTGGKTHLVTRDVIVEANAVPTITLIGDNPFELEQNVAYVDPGATAADTEDGDITANLVVDTSGVDHEVIGTYSVTYEVTDAYFVTTTVERTVNVVAPNLLPTITLLGDNPENIVHGTERHWYFLFRDDPAGGLNTYEIALEDDTGNSVDLTGVQGYSSTDWDNVFDGNTAGSTGNTGSGGNYDSLGFYAKQAQDEIIPTKMIIHADDKFNDGNSMITYMRIGYVDEPAGSLVKSYSALTKPLNEVYYAVMPGDTIQTGGHTISFDETANALTHVVYTDPGATALDSEDGDITSDIVVSGDTVDLSSETQYQVVYTVTDSDGGVGTQTRVVNVTPNTLPAITIAGDNPLSMVQIHSGIEGEFSSPLVSSFTSGDWDAFQFTKVSGDGFTLDTSDGRFTQILMDKADMYGTTIVLTDSVTNVDVPVGDLFIELRESDGTYDSPNYSTEINEFPLNSIDLDSLTESQYKFNIYLKSAIDTTNLVLSLVKDVGGYVEQGATASDTEDGDITPSIIIDDSALDDTTVGAYDVHYHVTDSNGGHTVETRVVNVVPNTSPVITMLGDNPLELTVGTAYVEPGATAVDNEDGDITNAIVIDASEVVDAIGTYNVTYNVTDSNGGNAIELVRVVNVSGAPTEYDIVDMPDTITFDIVDMTTADPVVIPDGPNVQLDQDFDIVDIEDTPSYDMVDTSTI